ncbi:aminotransferase class III-fold pyridoxal phosphate-dependent enzyme, partial [Burkholderia pseudomallei]|uniref:aminotransferase class III-fold pyridoxal phosphate-dependent enzyme n=1 Tax=Burkholderia pseudomallei TaxID=28450 RepID=UPI0021F78977
MTTGDRVLALSVPGLGAEGRLGGGQWRRAEAGATLGGGTAATGAMIAPVIDLEGVRALCDKHGIRLIFDGVITGCGQHGAPFMADVVVVGRDLLAMAKGANIAAVPLGAVAMANSHH